MSAWLRELGLGARLARSGGPGSTLRLALTALGVGLGVALLLVAASLPNLLQARDARTAARDDHQLSDAPQRAGADTLLVADADSQFRDRDIRGRALRAEGPAAPVPPGLRQLPRPGELYVSPALAQLLRSDGDDGALLRERFPQAIAGTIGDAGLDGPAELAFYLGSAELAAPGRTPGDTRRIDRFVPSEGEGLNRVIQMLAVVVLAALLLPVAVFIAAAARFGGEARDRRLAALRLLGADTRMTRRIAAGEALVAGLLGLALGTLLFLLARGLADDVTLFQLSVFSADLTPSLPLAVSVVVGVPAATVAVTLVALRGVTVEPLGLVRRAAPRPRRLWWRLALPALGAALLLPLAGEGPARSRSLDEHQLAAGVVLVLVGVSALLPWVVEAVVRRLDGGGVAWQLATRRLQLDSGTSARVVSGIAVAVAGAIALQTTFSAVESDYAVDDTDAPAWAQVANVWATPSGTDGDLGARRLAAALDGADGAVRAVAVARLEVARGNLTFPALIADCATVSQLMRVDRCADGDSFLPAVAGRLRPGAHVAIGDGARWRIPRDARVVQPRDGNPLAGGLVASPERLLLTPGALDGIALPRPTLLASVRLDLGTPDAIEHVRNAAARIDPTATTMLAGSRSDEAQYANLRRALFAGAVAVLLLIGASMLVSGLEQLGERRRSLAVLAAFGTPRSAVARSILWQTAIPVGLGLALAVASGVGLAAALLPIVGAPVRFDAGSIAGLTAAGAAVVLLVTLATLPALRRTMRPEGLRAE